MYGTFNFPMSIDESVCCKNHSITASPFDTSLMALLFSSLHMCSSKALSSKKIYIRQPKASLQFPSSIQILNISRF